MIKHQIHRFSNQFAAQAIVTKQNLHNETASGSIQYLNQSKPRLPFYISKESGTTVNWSKYRNIDEY